MKPAKIKSSNRQSLQRRRFYLEPEKILIIKQVLLGLFLLTLVSGIIAGVWYGTRVQSLTISKVEAIDGQTIQAETVKAKVDEVLAGDYWHFIPRRFSWFYPEAEVFNKLQEIERIKDVRLEKVSNTELKVTFSEYLPYALWCDESNKHCYFIDDKGFSFGKAPELTGGSLIRYHKLAEEPQLRTDLISSDDFNKIKEFNHLLLSAGWYVVEVEIDTVRDVFYMFGDGSEIRATLEADPGETFTYFDTLKKSEEFAHLKPGNFQYIDLRFGAKVYVNEESDLAVASSTEEINSEGEGEAQGDSQVVATREIEVQPESISASLSLSREVSTSTNENVGDIATTTREN